MPINLNEEQKQIGQDNFDTAVGMTRRDFLVGASAASVGAGAYYFGYKKLSGDRVKVGFIGTGDEGSVLLTEHPPEYMDVVAIADLRPTNRRRAFTGDGNTNRVGLNEKLGRETASKIRRYSDHKEMLENEPDIEAVVIAVPLSGHQPITMDCLEAGKHVLTEKLMARTIPECKAMIRKAKEKGLLLAVGHQRHYSVLYDNANFLIKQGLLGDIKHIRASWHRQNSLPGKDSWRKPVPPGDLAAAESGELSEERLKEFGYDSLEQLVRWRLYQKTGAGLMAELGSHQLDACSIFLGKVKPLAVQGYGGKNFYGVPGVGPKDKWDDDREIDDHVYTTFEFPGPNFDPEKWAKDPKAANDVVVVTYSSLNTNGREPYGETIFGSRGTLFMIQEQDTYLYKESTPSTGLGGFDQRLYVLDNKGAEPVLAASESLAPTAAAAAATAQSDQKISRGYTEEMEHFCYCIREGIDAPPSEGGLKCNGTVAMGDAIMALTSNMAMQKMQRVVFDSKWFDPNEEAVPEDMIGGERI